MKKIIVSGSTSGIGEAITKKLIEMNYVVIGLARQHGKCNFPKSHYFPYFIDFSELDGLTKKLTDISREHDDIEGIICCAGVGIFKEVEQFSFLQMQEIMNINFLSQALLIRTFLPQLKRLASSKIVVIGSESALEGQNKGSMYCASKFALRGFCQSLRKECAPSNVAVTIINPGMVRTPFFNELNFSPADDHSNAIDPNQIAKIIELLMRMQNNCVFEELNLKQMKKVIRKK